MKLTPENLLEQGFTLQDELAHQNLVPFIRMYMKKRTTWAIIYQVLNGLAAAVLLYAMFGLKNDLTWDNRIMQVSFGLVASFLLIPLHEYIHVLAYKSQGAQHTSYAANIKKFYFMALADGFVANRKAFRVVALAPFVTITLALMMVALWVPGKWCILPLTTLLAHAAMCSGDFGLLSYFDVHKDKEVVTYDDVKKGMSYFYVREAHYNHSKTSAKTDMFNHHQLDKKKCRKMLMIEGNAFFLNNIDDRQKVGIKLGVYHHVFRVKYNGSITALQ